MTNLFIVIFAVFFTLILGKPAYAYLDVGTGSYFLQVIIAGFLGFLVALKIYWKKIVGFVSGFLGKNKKKN